MKPFSYLQRDGKTVTVDAKGRMRRVLPSGIRDPEPIAGTTHPYEQVWRATYEQVRIALRARLRSEVPLTVEEFGFACPKPEPVNAFNSTRAEWRQAALTLLDALWRHVVSTPSGCLGRRDRDLLETILEAVGGDELELADFLEEAGEDGYENPRLQALVDRLNETSERLGKALDDLAETAR